MALTLTLNSVDMTDYVDFRTIRIQRSQEVSGSTLQFTMRVYGSPRPLPKEGMEVILTDASTREFGGTILRRDITMGEANLLLIINCECVGYSYLLDRRLLNKIYASAAVNVVMKEMLDDLKNAADVQDGDAHYDDFQADKTQIADGPVVKQHRFERVLPTQAMQSLAESSGMFFSVDAHKRVNLKDIEASAAPLPTEESSRTLSSGGDPILDVENDLESYFNLAVSYDISGVGTKVILLGAVYRSTATQTDSFVWHTNENRVFHLSHRPFSELDITRVRANSVTLTQKLKNVDEALASGNYWLNIGSRGQNQATVEVHADDIADGQVVDVLYTFSVEDDNENIDPGVIAELAEITGGDGHHEFVYTRASQLAVVNQADLDLVSDVILARKSKILLTGRFTSLVKGWDAGQTFTLKWLKADISERVYVITVRKTVRTPAHDPTLGDNIIESEVHFSNIPRGIRL
jgi:hypothetical protein